MVSDQRFLLLPTGMSPKEEAQFDVGKSGHAAPDDCVARRRVQGTSQVAAEPSELHWAGRHHRPVSIGYAARCGSQPIERLDFERREGQLCRRLGRG